MLSPNPQSLECSLESLHLSSFGLMDTTLEEVFLKVSEEDQSLENSEAGELAGPMEVRAGGVQPGVPAGLSPLLLCRQTGRSRGRTCCPGLRAWRPARARLATWHSARSWLGPRPPCTRRPLWAPCGVTRGLAMPMSAVTTAHSSTTRRTLTTSACKVGV